MKLKKYFILIFIILVFFISYFYLSRYEFRENIYRSTLLLSEFYSNQSPVDVKKNLSKKNIRMELKKTHFVNKGIFNEELKLEFYQINRFRDLGEAGDLTLIFFNNRLMAVIFTPKNLERYFKKISNEIKVSESLNKNGEIEVIEPRSNVDFYFNETDGSFVWRDHILNKDYFNWVLQNPDL